MCIMVSVDASPFACGNVSGGFLQSPPRRSPPLLWPPPAASPGWPVELVLQDARFGAGLPAAPSRRPPFDRLRATVASRAQTDDGIERGDKHGWPSWQVRPSPLRGAHASTAFGVS